MRHSSSQMSPKDKRTVRDEERTIQVAIAPAYKDETLSFTKDTDGATNQCARPQKKPVRTFHCSVCNTTLRSKSDYEDHITQNHKKKSTKKDSRHSSLKAKIKNETNIDYGLITKNKMMNPAKIIGHSGLIYAENRLIRARYKHHVYLSSNSRNSDKLETIKLLTDDSQATDIHNQAVADTSCQAATTSATGALDSVSNNHRTSCKITLDPDKLHRCSVSTRFTAPHHKRRKLNTASDIVDIEAEDQKMQRALSESLQGSQVEVEIDPVASNVSSYPHPVINDPNNYCRICNVSHSTQEAYQIHLQTEHHVAFPSSSAKRKAQKPPTVTHPDKLCKYMPIQIAFDPKPSPTTTRGQMKDANVQPDLDDPNHYCRSCHITKPSRTSYLTHLCMIHQTTSRKQMNSKASNVKTNN
ncbi:uncharacterized protein ATC70_013050 [Mucor velutinosus]|uniref:C2H2-type domain-containing protein n=1 Tax=Mucor velutinosus TaxID=708070 RepID=A0AAN7I4I0_9FUNG|nr:hypothetical protein ATC70_013050 [Mucor velutinosus]